MTFRCQIGATGAGLWSVRHASAERGQSTVTPVARAGSRKDAASCAIAGTVPRAPANSTKTSRSTCRGRGCVMADDVVLSEAELAKELGSRCRQWRSARLAAGTYKTPGWSHTMNAGEHRGLRRRGGDHHPDLSIGYATVTSNCRHIECADYDERRGAWPGGSTRWCAGSRGLIPSVRYPKNWIQ